MIYCEHKNIKENTRFCQDCQEVVAVPNIKTRIIPLSIQFEDKYWRIEYKDGKMTSETNMELDQATTIFFDALKKMLDGYFQNRP